MRRLNIQRVIAHKLENLVVTQWFVRFTAETFCVYAQERKQFVYFNKLNLEQLKYYLVIVVSFLCMTRYCVLSEVLTYCTYPAHGLFDRARSMNIRNIHIFFTVIQWRINVLVGPEVSNKFRGRFYQFSHDFKNHLSILKIGIFIFSPMKVSRRPCSSFEHFSELEFS